MSSITRGVYAGLNYRPGSADLHSFRSAFDAAMTDCPNSDAVDAPHAVDAPRLYFLLLDDRGREVPAGFAFAVGEAGAFNLTNVFGPGYGRDIMAIVERFADVAQVTVTLDCFDGFLPEFYARHGFVETRREANWTPGGPDVVYMTREL